MSASETVTNELCKGCGGKGWYLAPGHAPTCYGDCTEGGCPVPVQELCECMSTKVAEVTDEEPF